MDDKILKAPFVGMASLMLKVKSNETVSNYDTVSLDFSVSIKVAIPTNVKSKF